MKMFKFILAMVCVITLGKCVTFSTRSKSKKLMIAEEVLDSLKKFNNKFGSLKGKKLFIFFMISKN